MGNRFKFIEDDAFEYMPGYDAWIEEFFTKEEAMRIKKRRGRWLSLDEVKELYPDPPRDKSVGRNFLGFVRN